MTETYGLVDKTGWAPGPWDGEPDEVTDRCVMAGGLAVRAVRHDELGCWAGYVEVPLEHPWFGLEYETHLFRVPPDGRALDVHGGVTFTGAIGEGWWIGFDCGHYDDVMPGLDALLVRVGARAPGDPDPLFYGFYKTIDFVMVECGSLAMQVYLASEH